MKTLFLIVLLASPVFAKGPKHSFPDPKLNDELENVYYDISKVPNGVYKASSMTLQGLTVSSITIESPSSLSGLVRIKQIVQATTQTRFTTTSASFVGTNLSATITPTSTNSKVLVLAMGTMDTAAGQTTTATIGRYIGSQANIGDATGGFAQVFSNAAISPLLSLHYLDSPSTTSATTYQIFMKVTGGVSCGFGSGNDVQTMILVELL